MKKLILFGCIISAYFSFNSQVTNYKWNTCVKFSGGIIDTASYINGGLSAEYMLFKRMGLNYNIEFQRRTDHYNHLHGSIGPVGGPVIFGLGLAAGLANSADSDTSNNSGIGVKGMLLGLLVLAIPDGLSYHIPVSYKLDIATYANFLGFDWIRNKKTGYSQFKYACSFGVRGTYLIRNRLTASGFIETRKCAPTGWGIGGGVGLGFLFKARNKKS
jgi:hypothetical protein